jgi:hypothetical protein
LNSEGGGDEEAKKAGDDGGGGAARVVLTMEGKSHKGNCKLKKVDKY